MPDKASAVNRRRVLKTVGVAGAGGFIARPVIGNKDDSVEIVTIKHGNEPIHTKEVDKEWYNQVKKSWKVNSNIKNEYLNKKEVMGIGLINGEEIIGGRRKPAIKMYTKTGQLPADVPETVDGFEIITEKNPNPPSFNHCGGDNDHYNSTIYDPLKAGTAINSPHTGTHHFRMYDSDTDTYYMSTARHNLVLYCQESDTVNGVQTSQCKGDFNDCCHYGVGKDEVIKHDIAVIEYDSGCSRINGFGNKIVGSTVPHWGHVTKSGVGDTIGDYVDMKGVETGISSNKLTGYDFNWKTECNSYNERWSFIEDSIEVAAPCNKPENQGGDSGAPIYVYNPVTQDYTHSIGIHSAGDNDTGKMYGAAGYAYTNSLGLEISRTSCSGGCT